MKNVVKILYGLLAIAIGISVFCVAMLVKNNDRESLDCDSVEEITNIFTQQEIEEKVEPFDNMVSGTGNLVSVDVCIDGVPCILYYKDNYEKHPVMILQHGMTSKKEDVSPLATGFAENGFLVVTPDAAAHGESVNNDEWTVPEMIQQTSDNFDIILNYLAQSSYADMERIAMSGISLGGLSVFHYSVNGSFNPKIIATMCATPEYSDLTSSKVANSYVKKGKIIAEGDAEKLTQLSEAFAQMSPYESILNDTDTCYYLLCGDQDDVVPYGGNVTLYEAMKDTAMDIILQVKPGQGHTVTEDDLWEVLLYVVSHI